MWTHMRPKVARETNGPKFSPWKRREDTSPPQLVQLEQLANRWRQTAEWKNSVKSVGLKTLAGILSHTAAPWTLPGTHRKSPKKWPLWCRPGAGEQQPDRRQDAIRIFPLYFYYRTKFLQKYTNCPTLEKTVLYIIQKLNLFKTFPKTSRPR